MYFKVGHPDIPRVWFLGRVWAQSTGSESKEHGVSETKRFNVVLKNK